MTKIVVCVKENELLFGQMSLPVSGNHTVLQLLHDMDTSPAFQQRLVAAVRENVRGKREWYGEEYLKLSSEIRKMQDEFIVNVCGIRKQIVTYEIEFHVGDYVFVGSVDGRDKTFTILPDLDYYITARKYPETVVKAVHDVVSLPQGQALSALQEAVSTGRFVLTPTLFSMQDIVTIPSKTLCAKLKLPRKPGVLVEENPNGDAKKMEKMAEALDLLDVQRSKAIALYNVAMAKTRESDETILVNCFNAFARFENQVLGQARDNIKSELYSFMYTFLQAPQFFSTSMMNFALLGGAGVGKTAVAMALADVLSNLGILLTHSTRICSRADLVGSYVGQTANKTRRVLVDSLEGVLFIDEAYAVAQGNTSSQKFDSFGREALNELVNFLDKNAGRLVVIAAGYPGAMNEYFFGANEGLPRRFPHVWTLLGYSAQDLWDISQRFYRTFQERAGPALRGLSFVDLFEDVGSYVEGLQKGAQECRRRHGGGSGGRTLVSPRFKNQAGDIRLIVEDVVSAYFAQQNLTGNGERVRLRNEQVQHIFESMAVKSWGLAHSEELVCESPENAKVDTARETRPIREKPIRSSSQPPANDVVVVVQPPQAATQLVHPQHSQQPRKYQAQPNPQHPVHPIYLRAQTPLSLPQQRPSSARPMALTIEGRPTRFGKPNRTRRLAQLLRQNPTSASLKSALVRRVFRKSTASLCQLAFG